MCYTDRHTVMREVQHVKQGYASQVRVLRLALNGQGSNLKRAGKSQIDGLDLTNNQAERQLRPGVIVRKTSGCNRTHRGAAAHGTARRRDVGRRTQALGTIGTIHPCEGCQPSQG